MPGHVKGMLVNPLTRAHQRVTSSISLGRQYFAADGKWQGVHIPGTPFGRSAILCLMALLIDLSSPPNTAAAAIYIPLVFCGFWFARSQTVLVFAALATALGALGYVFRSDVDAGTSPALLNRSIIIGTVWLVAAFAYQRHRAEQTFRRSAVKLNAVISHAIDGLISIDEQGLIEHFNPASERIFGYSEAEVLGRSIEMLMSEPNAHGKRGLMQHLSTRSAVPTGMVPCTVRANHKDGSDFHMELALSAFQRQDGIYVPGILRDISARKQGQERRALLAAIVASSEDAIISATLEGVITSWNGSAERLLGYSAAESIGRHVSLIVPPERGHEEANVFLRLGRGEDIQNLETFRQRKDGQRLCVSLAVSPVHDSAGQIVGGSMIMRDISARKKTEADLLRYTRELERSNKELDDFAYIASHDLKEPLRGIFNNATFLLEDYQELLDEQGVKRLRRLCYLSQRMEALVNDLLYFSRLGRQDLAIQPTDLNAVIHDIESTLDTTRGGDNARVVILDSLPITTCDKVRVTEVFRNLITNAIKYNDKESKIIEIGYIDKMPTPDGIQRQVFYVRDNGIGIDRKFYQDIFRIFKRLNEEDDSRKGTGVGLTFVQKIVDRHGGRIWLESTPGVGTTFYFTLAQGTVDDST
jgi:two-component system sensor kinase FixL